MIHKINLMGVPLQVEGLLFNIYTKTQRQDASHVGRMATFGIIAQIRLNPRRGGSKGKALTSIKIWDDSSSEHEHPRSHNHHSSSRSSRSSHK
jgi:hypothetical protein